MKILITGGAGFIGSYTARALLARGHHVTVLDNFLPQIHTADRNRSSTWASIRDAVELVEGDVRDEALLQRVVPGFEAILHLAAETGTGQSMYAVSRYSEVNVEGTARLLQTLVQSRGQVRRLVVASSRAVYGEGAYRCAAHGLVFPHARDGSDMAASRFEPRCPHCQGQAAMAPTPEDALLRPASVYAVTKLTQEQLVLAVGASIGVSAAALRYQNVYGPGQSLHNPYTGILSIFSKELRAGRDIEIFEDGLESRDFVHVQDVAHVNVAFLESEAGTGQPVNVGTGLPTSVMEVAEALKRQYGAASNLKVSGRYRAGDIRHASADTQLLRACIGFTPQTSFADGIAGFCRWASGELAQLGDSGHDSYRQSLHELEQLGLMGGARPTPAQP